MSNPLSCKTAASRRLLLLSSPDSVDPRDVDHLAMDTSAAHREYMKNKLYGHQRTERLKEAKAGTYCEAGDHSVNYADEVPPKWISTSKAEYTHKIVDLERDKIESVANYIRKNHFTLTGPGEPEKNYTSVTRKDYIYTDTHKATDRSNYKELIHSYSAYPPIYRDEKHESLPSRRDIKEEELANAKPVFDYPLPKAHMVITPTSKTQTHFSLGDDEGQWESVTKSSMKLNGTPDMVQYGRQDRKRSTVLDHPDLEKVPMQSVHQQDFKGAVPVTGATSNDFVKELKATHFSLGDTGMNFGISQYQATYKPSTGPAPHRNRELPPSAFPAPKQCIILEDFPDRCLGKSSQRDDYRDFSGHVKAQAQAGRQMKEVNSKSSVYFGLDGSGLSNKSHSVTSGDFAKPAERDFALAQESYGKAGVSRKPDIPFYDPINVESETMHGVTSVAQSDFHSHPIKFTARQDGIDNKAYLRTHHFSFGELEKEETAFAMQSSSQYHFKDPEARRTNPYNIERRDAAGAFNGKTSVGSRHESDNYEKTLMNTISRDLGFKNGYETVSSMAYKPFKSVDRAQAVRPRQDLVGEHLHPMLSENGPIRELTTVSRRSYVPPEVMKYCQPQKAVGVNTTVVPKVA